MQKKISERLQDVKSACEQFRSKAAVLRHLKKPSFVALFDDNNLVLAEQALIAGYAAFNRLNRVKVVGLDNCDVTSVFDRYFAVRAPFGSGKKKAEFPDAFVLSALEAWSTKTHHKLYVVSSDPDIAAACEVSSALLHLKSPEQLLHLIASRLKKLGPYVQDLVNRQIGSITDGIENAFMNMGFVLDAEGDVESVEVIAVEDVEPYIIHVEPREAVIEVAANVQYKASITLDVSVWDGVDKEYVHIDTKSATLEREEEIKAIVKFSFEMDDPESFEIESVEISKPLRDIFVHVEEDPLSYK